MFSLLIQSTLHTCNIYSDSSISKRSPIKSDSLFQTFYIIKLYITESLEGSIFFVVHKSYGPNLQKSQYLKRIVCFTENMILHFKSIRANWNYETAQMNWLRSVKTKQSISIQLFRQPCIQAHSSQMSTGSEISFQPHEWQNTRNIQLWYFTDPYFPE